MNFGQLLDLSPDELTLKLGTVAAEIDEHQQRGCRYSLMERVGPERGKDHDSLFPALRCPTPISGIAIDAGLGFPTARGTTGKQTDDDALRPHVTRFRREVSAFSAQCRRHRRRRRRSWVVFFRFMRCGDSLFTSGSSFGNGQESDGDVEDWSARVAERKISQNPLLSFYEL
jgi:hypothetical protein